MLVIACVSIYFSEDHRLDEQKKWLDGEIEKVLKQREEMANLEKVKTLKYVIEETSIAFEKGSLGKHSWSMVI